MSNVSMIDGHIDEPKDNEIIKALECCFDGYCESCVFNDDINLNCKDRLIENALNLLERKDEQINGLIAGQETLQKHLAEKNAEIEILIRKKESLRDEICELQSEIERLKEFEYMYNSLLK